MCVRFCSICVKRQIACFPYLLGTFEMVTRLCCLWDDWNGMAQNTLLSALGTILLEFTFYFAVCSMAKKVNNYFNAQTNVWKATQFDSIIIAEQNEFIEKREEKNGWHTFQRKQRAVFFAYTIGYRGFIML